MSAGLDIQLGDTVRLRNGETFVVRETATSYTDRDGTHDGPFVSPNGGGDFYLVADVVEVVERNANVCVLCGGGVTSNDPEKYPYCQSCHYTGSAAEARMMNNLLPLRLAFPDADVGIDHTGGGCFMVRVEFPDGGYYGLTEGEAGLPLDADGNPLDGGGGWGLVMFYADEECEGDVVLDAPGLFDEGSRYWDEYPAHSFSDAQVVEAIKADRVRRGDFFTPNPNVR